ncbi:branched-chain amino acid ABC transporter permease [Paraburkholderia sp. HD33-4]|uniref:branched-chain amino acid ABC transporter permease n=1 Tax=Paraburkholderia sp. HD33-4 TaxID=2883242 RepID=UPI001F3239ED|nr:branched-chain amino acid ABC transporter permease [Paraburkholderia sp. HD33-4]
MIQLAGWISALMALYLFPVILDVSSLRLVIEILYFGLFAASFNLLFGYGGMLSFGHAAAFGVGGYAVGLTWKFLGAVPVPLTLIGCAFAGASLGIVVGVFCVRARGTAFSMLTLAFSQFLYAVAVKWRTVTRGDDGLSVRPPDLSLPGGIVLHMNEPRHFYWLELTVVMLCLAAIWHIKRTPLGNSAVTVRENDERAAFLGYNVFATRLIVFCIASSLAAVAGGLFASFQELVSPEALDFNTSAEVVLIALLGGTGTLTGPLLGAGAYILLQNWLSSNTEHWTFVIGLLFVLLVLFMRTGLVGIVGQAGLIQHLIGLWRSPRRTP